MDKEISDQNIAGADGWRAYYKRPWFALALIAGAYALLVVMLLTAGESLPETFPAPEFSLRNIMGPGEVSLSEYSGRPVVLYFFASW